MKFQYDKTISFSDLPINQRFHTHIMSLRPPRKAGKGIVKEKLLHRKLSRLLDSLVWGMQAPALSTVCDNSVNIQYFDSPSFQYTLNIVHRPTKKKWNELYMWVYYSYGKSATSGLDSGVTWSKAIKWTASRYVVQDEHS